MNLTDLTDLIYFISPPVTPFLGPSRKPRHLGPIRGNSMRQRRRRLAKPIRFNVARLHEWVTDAARLYYTAIHQHDGFTREAAHRAFGHI